MGCGDSKSTSVNENNNVNNANNAMDKNETNKGSSGSSGDTIDFSDCSKVRPCVSKMLFNYDKTGEVHPDCQIEFDSMKEYLDKEMTKDNLEEYRKYAVDGYTMAGDQSYYHTAKDHCDIFTIDIPKMEGNDYDTPITCITPKTMIEDKCRPVMIKAHGGGGFAGSSKLEEFLSCYFADECQVCVIDVEYRLCPEAGEAKKMIMDAYQVVKYCYDNAEEMRIDKERICIYGLSGGGYVMAGVNSMMAMMNTSHMVKFALLENPVLTSYFFTDMIDNMKHIPEKAAAYDAKPLAKWLATDLDKQLTDGCPLLFPNLAPDCCLKRLAPVIICEGEFDCFITPAERWGKRLMNCERLLECVIYPGATHAYQMTPGDMNNMMIADRKKMIDQYLKY